MSGFRNEWPKDIGLAADVEDEREDNHPPCPMCNSTEASHLGKMGKLEWFRCRACGMDYY